MKAIDEHLLRRCHAELCERLGQLIASREAAAAEHREMAASGVYALPTELDNGREIDRVRRLIRDVEKAIGRRPAGTDRWIAAAIDDDRRAA